MKETIYSTDYQSSKQRELSRLQKLQETIAEAIFELQISRKTEKEVAKSTIKKPRKNSTKKGLLLEAILSSLREGTPLSNKEIRAKIAVTHPTIAVTTQNVSNALWMNKGKLLKKEDGKYSLMPLASTHVGSPVKGKKK